MARSRRRLARLRRATRLAARALACVAVLAVASVPASALRALHVDALGMHADKTHVHVGEVFHLAIHAHVRENVAALDELVIPDVGAMLLEGDERRVSSSPSGSDVIETLTLEPTQAGTFTFAGAYLDAVDARTNKPSRFSANPVRIVVDQPSGQYYGPPGELLRGLRDVALAVLGWLALGLAVGLALWWLRRVARSMPPRPDAAVPPPVAPVAPVSPPSPRDAVRDALRAYRVTPSVSSLMAVRDALFDAAGVPRSRTLRDALAATPDPSLRAALLASEHAAFGPAHERDDASRHLIAATEEWLG